jgi:nicotinamidase-related amidase
MTTALILVDIQNDYFPGGRMELVKIQEASANAKELLSIFREKHRPTFHIQHVAASSKAPFFRPDTTGIDFHDSIEPLPEETIIQKHYPNSFRETVLEEALKKLDIDQVVICGAMSHMCIDATTRAASDLGFGCTVVHDACATRDLEFGGKTIPAEEVHGAFMAALGWGYARVMSLKDFLSGKKNR